jgi:hypothetical protein
MRTPTRSAAAVALAAVTALAGLARQPPAPKPGDAMIEKYLAAETDRLSRSGSSAGRASTASTWTCSACGRCPRRRP